MLCRNVMRSINLFVCLKLGIIPIRWIGPITMPPSSYIHMTYFFSSFWDGSRTKRREEIAQKRKRRGSNKWPLTLYPPWSQKSSTLLTLTGIFFSSSFLFVLILMINYYYILPYICRKYAGLLVLASSHNHHK